MELFDLVVLGAGPGGYVAAIRAAQLGLKTALVEKRESLGGTCLNIGCIPSKALLQSSEFFHAAAHGFAEHGIEVNAPALNLPVMMARKLRIVKELTDGIALLMKKNKVTVLRGHGELKGEGRVAVSHEGVETMVEGKTILLATGSEPVALPFAPFDGKHVVSSTEALSFESVPGRLLVIGGGAIGLELGSVWARLGSQVTVLELMDEIVPTADGQCAKMLARSLKQQGLALRTGTRVTAVEVMGDDVKVTVRDKKDKEEILVGDKLLVAVGRKAHSAGLGLEAVGVERDERGRVKVDAQFRTKVPGILAIGDLIAGPMLAHKASEEAVAAVEMLAGHTAKLDPNTIPSVVYTWPELAQVGLTEDEAKARGIEVKTGKSYFKANGRAKSLGMEDGLVKVVADAQTGRLLGVHIVGPNASELIAEGVTALACAMRVGDLGQTCHAHPTLSEVLKEAAEACDGRAIHG